MKNGKRGRCLLICKMNTEERTITAWQGAAPLKIWFTFQGLRVAERVPCITAKCHQRADVEVVAMSLSIDGYTRVHAVV